MKFSSKTTYGLLIMSFFAKSENQNKIFSAGTLAERVFVPLKYLEKLMSNLKKANIVIATRGTSGGYKLARDAKNIFVSEIVYALEGHTKVSSCAFDGCKNKDCPNSLVFKRIYNSIDNALNGLTLFEISNGEKK